MSHLENEIKQLKTSLLEMMSIVISQHDKAHTAIETFDRELAEEIHINEKLLDSLELKHDLDCENIIALYNPVAIDLRFVLAVLKINYNLERIGDYANSFANMVRKSETSLDTQLLKDLHIHEMFETAHIMMIKAYQAIEQDDIRAVRNIADLDKRIDEWNKDSTSVLNNYILKNPSETIHALELSSIMHKLERVGDHIRNITAEIIFYLDARIIKHKKLNKNLKPEL